MNETITRSITGIVFIGLVLASLLFHPLAYVLLFSAIVSIGWLEYSLIFPDRVPSGTRVPGAVLLGSAYLFFFFLIRGNLDIAWLILPAALPLLLMAIYGLSPGRGADSSLPFTLGGMLYLLAGFSSMHLLETRWILFVFYLLWMNDTMAYVVGRFAGRRRIWPAVSPSKTWEGTAGGAAFALALAILLSRFYPVLSPGEWAVFAGIVIVAGTLGDFLESWIKRLGGVKDSGSLLPGHGGLLDRFDSFILAMPFAALYLTFTL